MRNHRGRFLAGKMLKKFHIGSASLLMTNNLQITASPALVAWLEIRKNAIALKESFRQSGGHMMLKSTSVDPYALEEPLRSEAVAYLEEEWRLEDVKRNSEVA